MREGARQMRRGVAWVLLAVLLLPLAGCGLSPMYAENSVWSEAASAWDRIEIRQPSNRLEQVVYQELLRGLPEPTPGSRPYVLRVSVSESDYGLLRDTLRNRRLNASYTLLVRASGKTLTSGSTFADASYEKTRLHFADARAQDDARRRAAKVLARDIRTRVAAFFARGGASGGAVASGAAMKRGGG